LLWPVRQDNWRSNALPAKIAFCCVINAIAAFEPVTVGVPAIDISLAHTMLDASPNVSLKVIEANDCWVRDSGPTFLLDDNDQLGGVHWDFNAWGKLYEPYDADQAVGRKILTISQSKFIYKADFVLEGGSIHTDGDGTVLTTDECLLNINRNPHLSKSDIERRLQLYLNCEVVIWIPRGLFGDIDTNGHIDNLCCFASPGNVILAWSDDPSDPQYEISREAEAVLTAARDARGRSLRIHKLPVPPAMFYTKEDIESYNDISISRSEGQRLAASYVNFYICNG